MKFITVLLLLFVLLVTTANYCAKTIDIQSGKIEVKAKDHLSGGDEIALFQKNNELFYRTADNRELKLDIKNINGFRNDFAKLEDATNAIQYKAAHPDVPIELGDYAGIIRSINLQVYDERIRNTAIAKKDLLLVKSMVKDALEGKVIPGVEKPEYIEDFKKKMPNK